MELLGHSQISLTLDTYSHVLPGLGAEAAKRMDEALDFGRQNGRQTGEDSSNEGHEPSSSGEKMVKRASMTRVRRVASVARRGFVWRSMYRASCLRRKRFSATSCRWECKAVLTN